MDNISLSEKWAMDAFKDGLRAVIRSGGKYYCRPSVNGGKYVIGIKTEAFWHALRAYQDADRKNGVPIGPDYFSHEKNYETIDCHFEFRRGGLSGDGRPYINVFALKNMYSVHCHAKFTNFRWRAGYPKGGQKANCLDVICDPESCSMDRPGCKKKGGQNG